MGLPSGVLAVAVLLATGVNAPAPGQRIEEARYLTVGGIEQWVTIRGDDDRKPVLLLVHGGPGDAQSPFVTTYAPYEHDFVLVQWDERGAGRTFARNGAAGVTLDRQIADGIDLAGQLRARFPKQPLILLGHSWGSVIATGMAQQRPDLFAAYVGTGQVSKWADSVRFQFDFLKDVARRKNDAALLASLEAIGTPDPLNTDQYFRFSRPLRQHVNPSDAAWFAQMLPLLRANGETEADIKAMGDGMNASGSALIQSAVHEDLPATAAVFKLPYYVIQGRHDLFTPTSLAERYFASVSAPKKRFVVIETAGHFALATHAQEFLTALKKVLRDD
jgi:pimeloyl-ACP methyl ester carboxylesterase